MFENHIGGSKYTVIGGDVYVYIYNLKLLTTYGQKLM